MIRMKTQRVLHNLGNVFKMNTFLTLMPRAVFRTQSKVYAGVFFAKIVNYFLLLTFFCKKAPPQMLDCVACKKRNKLTYIILHTFT